MESSCKINRRDVCICTGKRGNTVLYTARKEIPCATHAAGLCIMGKGSRVRCSIYLHPRVVLGASLPSLGMLSEQLCRLYSIICYISREGEKNVEVDEVKNEL
jgi:hypothetical protein